LFEGVENQANFAKVGAFRAGRMMSRCNLTDRLGLKETDFSYLGPRIMGILIDSAIIAYKSPIVIGKRLLKFAKGGPSAPVEATRMVAEKAELAAISVSSVASGRSLGSVVKRYRRKVEANARRL
jgi:hypothetical protein